MPRTLGRGLSWWLRKSRRELRARNLLRLRRLLRLGAAGGLAAARHKRRVRHDLDDVHVEIEVGVGTEGAARGRVLAIGKLARDVDLVLAALLHLGQRFGEARDDLTGDHRLRAAMALAGVEDGAVGKTAFIFDQHAVD